MDWTQLIPPFPRNVLVDKVRVVGDKRNLVEEEQIRTIIQKELSNAGIALASSEAQAEMLLKCVIEINTVHQSRVPTEMLQPNTEFSSAVLKFQPEQAIVREGQRGFTALGIEVTPTIIKPDQEVISYIQECVGNFVEELRNEIADDERLEGKFKDVGQLSAAFEKFLAEKKGYHKSIMTQQERDGGFDDRGIDKGKRQYMAIFEPEKQKQLAIVEFGLREDESTIQMAWEHLKQLSANTQSADIEGYVVFPDQADLGEDFSIIQFHKHTKEMQWIFCADFPDYEDLRMKVDGKGRQEGEGKSQFEQEIANLEERYTLKFSLGTESIMKVAIPLAVKEEKNDWKLTTREILVAIAYSGKRKEKEYRTAQFVLEKLRSSRSDYLEDYFKQIDSETSTDKKIKGKVLKHTGYVGDVLREAKKFAISTTSKNLIQIRHLLASLLFFRVAGKETPGAHNVVKEAGIELPTFIGEFQQYVTNTFKDDNTEAWGRILAEIVDKPTGKEKLKIEPEKLSKYGKGHIATIQMDRISDVDLLGRDKLVLAFAGMFVHTKEVEGLTVALLGDWGEGKSTVMKLLRKNLNEKHPGRFDFATFNAWEYEHTNNIAAGLSQEVVKGLQCKWNIVKKIVLLLCFIFIEYWKGLLVKILYLMIPGAVILSMYYLKVLPAEYYQYLHYGFWGVLFFASIYIFKNAKFIFEHPLLTSMETYLKLPDYGKHLGLIPVLKRHLRVLCKLKLNAIRIFKHKWGEDRKLIVFVDDLDRCQTNCIARVLDSIRLVMSIPNVIVMIGIDYRIAFKAMENYYEKLGDKERDTSKIARDYLGKIIQLPVRLMPSDLKEIRQYVEKRLFPDAQKTEDVDVEIDAERDLIEPSMPTREDVHDDIVDHIPDEKKAKEPKSVEEILKDTTIERDMFSSLAKRFNFTNPRQLLRLRNSYRFLKVMDSDEKYDREILMKVLFWYEFLNNLQPKIRYQCKRSLTTRESVIEKIDVEQIVQVVREDIFKITEMPNYNEIERFVHIVVLPHSQGELFDKQGN